MKPLFQFGHMESVKRMGAYSFETRQNIIREIVGLEGGFCGMLVANGKWNYWFFAQSYGSDEDHILATKVLDEVKAWQDEHAGLIGKKTAKAKRADFTDEAGLLVLNPKGDEVTK